MMDFVQEAGWMEGDIGDGGCGVHLTLEETPLSTWVRKPGRCWAAGAGTLTFTIDSRPD